MASAQPIITKDDSATSRGETVVLPGQSPAGEYIMSVLLKRTYDIVPNGVCTRAKIDVPIIPGDIPWGDPLNSSIRYEADFIPFKLATDVVLNGTAYAPGGVPTQSCLVSLQVTDKRKEVLVIGDRGARFVKDGLPVFTDPLPFETMELKYERAYGGIDVYSNKDATYPYPRNPLGCGYVVSNNEQSVNNLMLPNLEDPYAPLTPEQLCVEDHQQWEQQPFPAGLGWYPKTWWARAQFAGIMPADRVIEQELRQAYAQFVPADQRDAYLNNGFRDMDFRFFNGASRGLVFPFLQGGEQIVTENLSPEGSIAFCLPHDTPRLGLDLGAGVHEPEVVMHTVMIRMDEHQLDILWRGAVTYPGPDWLPQMQKMEVLVT
jgi:hypothetical protein